MNQTPPGWYQDPQGAGQRYWNGTAWTDQVAPAQPAAPVVVTSGGGSNVGKIVGIVVGVIVVIFGVLVLIGALSPTKIDATKAENLVRSHINGAQSVTCPSGIEAKSGRTFDCTVTLTDGSTETVTLHINDDSGNAQFSQSDVHRP